MKKYFITLLLLLLTIANTNILVNAKERSNPIFKKDLILYSQNNEKYSIFNKDIILTSPKLIFKDELIKNILKKTIISTEEIEIMMVGDNLIHSPIYKTSKQSDGTYKCTKLYENIKTDIEKADISIINQETIFINDNNKISSYPQFGSPTAIGQGAVEAGFDIIAHATNHTLDKNIEGVQDTLNFWKQYPEITVLGIHETAEEKDYTIIEEKGIKIAFVNYTYGLNGLDSRLKDKTYLVDRLSDNDIEKTMQEAEEIADYTIAILHVGDEYVYEPSKYHKNQVNKFINLGADIILCAHPHVIEPYGIITTEEGNTALVYYSLGNFISGQDKFPRIIGGMAKINLKIETNGLKEKTIKIENFDMLPLITHQQSGYYTTFKLENYTEELWKKHKLYNKMTLEEINDFFNEKGKLLTVDKEVLE